jgi:hypothetical protein
VRLLVETHAHLLHHLTSVDGDHEDSEEQDVELDPGTTALLERASRALDHPAIDAEVAEQLRQTVANIRQAAVDGDGDHMQAWCDALIDLLFEVEE